MKGHSLIKIIILFVLIATVYPHRYEIIAKVRGGINYYLPCTLPITYSIGTFDTRFDISREKFLQEITQAEKIWEDAAGKELFRYVEKNGTVTINLIYDSRQATTKKLQKIDGIISDKKSRYDDLRGAYDTQTKKLISQRSEYDQLSENISQMKQSFSAKVTYWNQHGGAPEGEYEKMQAEQKNINQNIDALNIKLSNLNASIRSINSLAQQINTLIDELHLDVEKYNTTRSINGEEFSEGEYTRNGPDESINIYEFSNPTKLFRVLVHELGHALGLQHVDDKNAIMYRLNAGVKEVLTEADKNELSGVCHTRLDLPSIKIR